MLKRGKTTGIINVYIIWLNINFLYLFSLHILENLHKTFSVEDKTVR